MNYDSKKILNAVNELIPLKSEDTILITGSIIEGFGNLKSDLDVFVFKDDFKKIRDNRKNNDDFWFDKNTISYNVLLDNERYDYCFYEYNYIESLIIKMQEWNYKDDPYVYSLDLEELNILHRIKISKNIFGTKTFEKIEWEKLNYVLSMKKIVSVLNVHEDIEGAYLSRDFETLRILLYEYLIYIGESFLAIEGETNTGRKWFYKKQTRLEENSHIHLVNNYIEELYKVNIEDLLPKVLNLGNELLSIADENIGGIKL